MIAWVLWGICALAWRVRDGVRVPSWSDAICSVALTTAAFLAYPVAVGGWFLVWGDNGPPHPILDHFWFNATVGLMLHAAVGAVVWSWVASRQHAGDAP